MSLHRISVENREKFKWFQMFIWIFATGLLTTARCNFLSQKVQRSVNAKEYSINVFCPKMIRCQSRLNQEHKLVIDCSNKNCTEFPSGLPYNTSHLILDKNKITTLNDSTFLSLTELITFSAKSNQLKKFEKGAFHFLPNLTHLDLYENHIVNLDDNLFNKLKSLIYLNLGHNRIAAFNWKALIGATELVRLELYMNSLNDFPVFVDEKNASVVPKLSHLDLDVNNIESIPINKILGLNNLTHLNICCNRLTDLKNHSLQQFPNLRSLKIHRNQLKHIDALAFKSEILEDINLKNSYISIDDIFHHTPNLRKLEITNNFVKRPATMFQHFPKLIHLDLGETRVKFGMNMFNGTPNIEYLDMSSNAISELGSQYFEHLKSLTTLDLYGNQLTTVNLTSLPNQLWKNLKRIDLSLNPYICDCGIVWFRKWLRTPNTTVITNNTNFKYVCIAPFASRNVAIKNLTIPTDLECFSSETDWCLYSVLIFIFTFGFTSLIISAIHRFRWHVRYWQFVYQKSRREQREILESRQFEYDAFIGYSEHDARWVTTQLIQNLEAHGHLRLCIHHRDWLCGRDIVDNVVDSLESSRKALLIVSNAFAESQWCLFELTMAQSRMIREDRDNVVLILLEEISSINMSPRLRHQMERQTYIEWTNNTTGQQLFWARLKQALAKPASSIFHSPTPFSTI